jgi:hypothetical protein
MLFGKQSKIDAFTRPAPPAMGRVHPEAIPGMVLWLMRRATAAVVALVCLAVPPAAAGPYSDFVVFGDSLSDVGNVFIATGGTQPAPRMSTGSSRTVRYGLRCSPTAWASAR